MSVIPEKEMNILNSTSLAHIATIGPHHEPQSTPVWFDWDGPGTKRLRSLEENIAAAHIVLSAEEVTQLEASVGQPAGDRKSEADLRLVSRE